MYSPFSAWIDLFQSTNKKLFMNSNAAVAQLLVRQTLLITAGSSFKHEKHVYGDELKNLDAKWEE